MAECSHDCSSCSQNCSGRTAPQDMHVSANEFSNIKKVIGVVSGKGGVGKSLVTSLLASESQKRGNKTAILDADITGPSIPRAFGVNDQLTTDGKYINPSISKCGIEIVSTNLLLDDETQPVVWRGPIIAGAVKQFWNEVNWGDIDYMFVDMPPGTGDVPLTVFQSIRLDGIVIVTSPQELVSMIVSKAVNMAEMMGVPILGIVENMSYVKCPCCGEEIKVFGESHTGKIAEENHLGLLARLPFDPEISTLCDKGEIESYECDEVKVAADMIFRAVAD
ncbi:MAG: Mrp/NBP35 family ATP-binding protein [Oscillospiraceae bacterium]|nr:Mrp/NBP35 family ATP-binding protein [Oscillospiraceae bacterium]